MTGILIGNSASGSMDLENIDLDGQNNAGVYYAKDVTGTLTGEVTNSAGAAFKYGQNTDNDVSFDSMSISSNAIGVETDGAGDITLTDVTMGNTKDVVISSAANVDFIEGTVDSSSVEVTGTGMFTRMRQLDVTLTADSSPVADATVTLIDADGASAGNGITDSLGVAEGLVFETATVNAAQGLVIPSLSGYEVMSVAEVAYSYTSSTNNIADFRYASQSVSLTDASGNTATVPLTTQITERVCWYSSSTAFTTVAPCAGSFSTSGSRTLDDGNGGSVNEYGYYGGFAASQSNNVIMVDVPYVYLKSATTYDFNGSTILATGAYDYYDSQRWYTRNPYGAEVFMNDAAVYGVSSDDEGDMHGVEIGYYGSPITSFHANNTVFSNVAKLEFTNGYRSAFSSYNWEIDDVSITNSTISHFQGYQQLNNAIQYTDICMVLGGGDGAFVSGNTFNDCGVGVMLQRSNYYNYLSLIHI